MHVTTMTSPRTATHPVLTALEPRLENDGLLRALRDCDLRVGLAPVRLSRIDEAACLVARGVLNVPAVALAFPRGSGPQAGMLGLFLAICRHIAPGRSGSVVVSSRRSETADELRDLTIDGASFAKLEVGRVVIKIVDGHGARDRRRPARKPLAGGERRGISQSDGYLLLCRPNALPPLAVNVVWAMVVDTIGCSRPRPGGDGADSWTRSWEANVADGRRQVWLGELDDPNFERFCAERSVPLVQFDWGLLAALAADEAPLHPSGPLSAKGLSVRAAAPPRLHLRPVEASSLDAELREAWFLYFQLRKACGPAAPKTLDKVAQLLGVLARLAVPLEAYERATARDLFAVSVRGLERELRAVSAASFVGNKTKAAFRAYWGPLAATIGRLIRRAEAEDPPKFEAIFDRAASAEGLDERLRVVCQTRAEMFALRDQVHEMDLDEVVEVVTPADVRPHGPSGSGVTTVLMCPPPPWRMAMLSSGERGDLEILCYPSERDRLEERLAAHRFDKSADNLAALRLLGFTDIGRPRSVNASAGIEIVNLAAHSVPTAPADDAPVFKAPDAGDPKWRELIGLYGQELRDEADLAADPASPGGADEQSYDGRARLVHFMEAERPVFLRDDTPVDVLDTSADGTVSVSPTALGAVRPGTTVAFLPGGGRSVLEELLAAFDASLDAEQRMFMPLWQRALGTAIERVGIRGVAENVERTTWAVRGWFAGHSTPREEWRLKRILELSGDEEALRAQAPIWALLTYMRGHHRHIGRLNNQIIAAVLRDEANPRALHELERKIGRPLRDLYDHMEPLTVESVGPAREVPLAACNRFLPLDDPLIAHD